MRLRTFITVLLCVCGAAIIAVNATSGRDYQPIFGEKSKAGTVAKGKKPKPRAERDSLEKELAPLENEIGDDVTQLPDGSTVFKSADGQFVVEARGGFGSIYLSSDGKVFYEVLGQGYSGSSEEHEISFENPQNNKRGEYKRQNDVVVMDGKSFTKTESPTEVKLVPLPEVRELTVLFSLSDEHYLGLTTDKYRRGPTRLYIGKGAEMIEVKITGDIVSFRDGGTTYVPTAQGVLYIPSGFKEELKPKWLPTPHKDGDDYDSEVAQRDGWKAAMVIQMEDTDRFTYRQEKGKIRISKK